MHFTSDLGIDLPIPKRPKIGTPETDTVILIKYNSLVYNAVIHPKDADGMANNADPDQTPPLGGV